MPSFLRRAAASRAMTCPAALAGALALLGVAGCTEPQRQGQPAERQMLISRVRWTRRGAIAAISLGDGMGVSWSDSILDIHPAPPVFRPPGATVGRSIRQRPTPTTGGPP